MTDPADDLLAQRYGLRPRWGGRRRALLATVGVLVLVGLTLAVFAWSRSGPPTATGSVVGYRALSDAAMEVVVDVHKPDGRTAVCRVQAKDRTATVVGSTEVRLPAAGSDLQRTVTVPTRGLAVVATVDACALDTG